MTLVQLDYTGKPRVYHQDGSVCWSELNALPAIPTSAGLDPADDAFTGERGQNLVHENTIYAMGMFVSWIGKLLDN